jgi:hypothetical protein
MGRWDVAEVVQVPLTGAVNYDRVLRLVYLISDHLSDSTAMSTSNTRKMRKARSTCRYSVQERGAIVMHRELYRSQITKELRGHIFRTKILPDMFNHWANGGAVSFSEDEVADHVKVCGGKKVAHC